MNELDMAPLKIQSHPAFIEELIEKYLNLTHLNLNQSTTLASIILKLSDFYISQPQGQTPWSESWAQTATLLYYFPLNRARNLGIIHRGLKLNFFEGLEYLIDFGAGLGATTSAFQDKSLNLSPMESRLIESASSAEKLLTQIQGLYPRSQWSSRFDPSFLEASKKNKTLSVFSYSLTELKNLPEWAFESEALMILEPSTQQDGRRLMELRQQLINKGFHIWAPCTHQQACPLLKDSAKDWCHDRFHLETPMWFQKIENHLPFKNQTITTSYLLARKSKPLSIATSSEPVATANPEKIRLVGDTMKEKGKTRQMICRGPHREFLSWLERDGQAPQWPRGELVDWPKHTEIKGSEIRVKKS